MTTAAPAADERHVWRYGQTRWTEIWLSCVMALYGAVLLSTGETFSLPSYRVIRAFVAEDTAGLSRRRSVRSPMTSSPPPLTSARST